MATQKAFLAGVNNYQSVSDLRGCVSDVDKMERLLTESFDFPAHNIRRLTDEQVIKQNVLHELDWLLGGAQAGDQLVLFFAGHGTQVLDQNGDEADGVDEVLCLWDMDFNNPESYLSDDDIHAFTQRLPDDVALTIIFDNCHSGTATRMLLTPETSRSLELPPNKTPLVDLSVTMARASETGTMRSLAPQKAIKRVLAPTNEAERRQASKYVAGHGCSGRACCDQPEWFRIVEHECQPLHRILRVERQIGGAGFENRKQCHYHVGRTWHRQGNDVLRPDSFSDQQPCQTVGAGIEFRIACADAFE